MVDSQTRSIFRQRRLDGLDWNGQDWTGPLWLWADVLQWKERFERTTKGPLPLYHIPYSRSNTTANPTCSATYRQSKRPLLSRA